MCRYILPLLADIITAVQQGIFVTWGLCQIQSYQAFKTKAKDLDCKAKAGTRISALRTTAKAND